MAAPRITKNVLDGLSTVLAYATAGGPDEIGIDWHPHAEDGDQFGTPEAERSWENVEAADDWLCRMFAYRQGEKAENPPPRIPAAILRGIWTAFEYAGADLEGDEDEEQPLLTTKERREFTEARTWVENLMRAKK